MIQRVFLQIIDNPYEDVIFSDELTFDESVNNQAIAEELQKSMDFHYPSMVHVEYVDLFLEEGDRFSELKEMLSHGLISLPIIMINGRPFLHGGISYSMIIEEIERLISSGPSH